MRRCSASAARAAHPALVAVGSGGARVEPLDERGLGAEERADLAEGWVATLTANLRAAGERSRRGSPRGAPGRAGRGGDRHRGAPDRLDLGRLRPRARGHGAVGRDPGRRRPRAGGPRRHGAGARAGVPAAPCGTRAAVPASMPWAPPSSARSPRRSRRRAIGSGTRSRAAGRRSARRPSGSSRAWATSSSGAGKPAPPRGRAPSPPRAGSPEASLGLTVTDPALRRATSLVARLREVARASGFRFREVRLDDGWWRHDVGGLVGVLDGERPVALVRRRGRYEIVDPGRGTRTPVDPGDRGDARPNRLHAVRLPAARSRPAGATWCGSRMAPVRPDLLRLLGGLDRARAAVPGDAHRGRGHLHAGGPGGRSRSGARPRAPAAGSRPRHGDGVPRAGLRDDARPGACVDREPGGGVRPAARASRRRSSAGTRPASSAPGRSASRRSARA